MNEMKDLLFDHTPQALYAIIEEKSPKKIKEIELTPQNAVVQYNAYCDALKRVFSEQWNERSVDQALWAYGHMLYVCE